MNLKDVLLVTKKRGFNPPVVVTVTVIVTVTVTVTITVTVTVVTNGTPDPKDVPGRRSARGGARGRRPRQRGVWGL